MALLFAVSSFVLLRKDVLMKWWTGPKVTGIWIYPIKSCRGIFLESCRITKRGFENDRIFMLVDKNNKFVSQRTYPRMALIDTRVENDVLVVSAPNMRPLCIDLSHVSGRPLCLLSDKKLNVSVWGDPCEAEEVADCEWFSEFLLGMKSDDIRLVRMTDECTRPTDPVYAPQGQAAFSDGFPFLLVSEESLEYVNCRLEKPVTMANFRPNIVVSGCLRAFAEDTWNRIVFRHCAEGTDSQSTNNDRTLIAMNVVKPCSRCKIPSINTDTGCMDPNNEPTRTLKRFRTGKYLGFKNEKWAEEVFFCQNVDHASQEGGVLSVGDSVRVKSFQRF